MRRVYSKIGCRKLTAPEALSLLNYNELKGDLHDKQN